MLNTLEYMLNTLKNLTGIPICLKLILTAQEKLIFFMKLPIQYSNFLFDIAVCFIAIKCKGPYKYYVMLL